MSDRITESNVLDALRSVMDPDLHRDIVSLNFIRNLKIEGGAVSFDVNLTTPACPVKERLREQSRRAVLDKVISKIDYKQLNEVPPFDKRNPSAENIARWIYDELVAALPAPKPSRVTVGETDEGAASFIPDN